ncbi:MAG: DUF2237 domain-containing protein [Deltaproteobacteria bacterium]|nr:DUF2237 domain-containing protein [Deltaproteobacteria bacterium]
MLRSLPLLFLSGCAAVAAPETPKSPTSTPACAAGEAACLGSAGSPAQPGSRNVLGGPLLACPSRHRTGFYRDGYCNTGADDHGVHVVCARVTDAFLAFSRGRGNDLVTPRGSFPGLKDGDGWCLCASRWQEAHEAGVAPSVMLEATHEAALRTSNLDALQRARPGP